MELKKQANSYRDDELDLIRAFSIFWVVLIHTLYWPGIIDQGILLSLFLIEMPLIFFITGASNIYAKRRNLFSFYFRRLKRVLIPYEFFAICVILLHYIFKKDLVNSEFLINWLIPKGAQYSEFGYLNWHMWFMPVYLLIVILLPILILLREKGFLKIFIIFSIILSIFWGTNENLITNAKLNFYIPTVNFYSLWTAIGFSFKDIKEERKKNNMKLPLLFIFLGFAIIFLLYKLNLDTNWNMQTQKIPVKPMFLGYSFISMSILYIISPMIIGIMKKLKEFSFSRYFINTYNTNGFTIYLFHSFIFLVLMNFFGDSLRNMNKLGATIIIFFIVSLTSPLLSTILSKLKIK